MPHLPKSWGLKTRKRTDGKLDIVGKTDAGQEYTVRTTNGPGVTDHDIAELRDADRENYNGYSRHEAARRYVDKIVTHGKKQREAREDAFGDDMVEAAGHVAFGLLDRKGHSSPFTGSTRAYRTGFENWLRTLGKAN